MRLFRVLSELPIFLKRLYSLLHDQLHPPPLASAPRFQIRHAHPLSLDCHQLYIVIVAKPYAWLQELCFWRPSSAVP
jgi:hypothetical protein